MSLTRLCALLCLYVISCGAFAQQPFSIVLMPDTQNYAEKPAWDVYAHQTQWIADQKNARNIKFVTHLGDITQHDLTAEWQVADAAHAILDNAGVPFSMTPGNHDLFPSKDLHYRESMFVNYFGPQRYANKPWYGGSFDSSNENNYMFFSEGNLQFMVVSLEFTPRKEVVTWANQVIQQHPNHRVIIATHCYQDYTGDHTTGWADHYNVEGREGVDLWEELIQRHSNIFLAVSGHIQGVSYRKRTGVNGNTVHEILSDFQVEPVLGNGTALGNGWLRVLNFDPANNAIGVETLTVEAGNTAIFPGGTPQFFLNYNQIASPTSSKHNLMDYSVSYNMQSLPAYQYAIGDDLYKDRHVHNSLRGGHDKPKVIALKNGNTLAAWQDDRDGNGIHQIYARVFDADGNAVTGEIVVNSVASGEQRKPAIAADDQGNFVVVWEDDQDNNGYYQILARGFYANGSERFADMTVNSVGSGQQLSPAVAMDYNGRFVVAWEDDKDGNGYYQILARGFNANGSQRFADRTVNSVAAGQQFNPVMAMDSSGDFVVVWEDDQNNDGDFTLLGRGFNDNGSQRFADMAINSNASGHQQSAAIGMDDYGRFTVAWQDDKDGNGYYQIMARAFNANGSVPINDFTVNSKADGQQLAPGIGVSGNGNFVVSFEDDNDDNGYFQIYAKAYSASGSVHTSDFTVNSDASGQQRYPVVGFNGSRYVIAWQDDMDSDGDYGILMRNFNY